MMNGQKPAADHSAAGFLFARIKVTSTCMRYTCTTAITQEGKWYVARCVELGVVSQGKTIPEAEKNLREAVELYLDDAPRKRRLLSKRAPMITMLDIQHG